MAQQNHTLTLLLDVVDDSILFRDPSKQERHGGDAVVLALVDPQQRVHRYLLSASTFGRINAYEYFGSYLDPIVVQRQSAIKAAWQRSSFGYRLEISLPSSMIDYALAIAIIDVDKYEVLPQVIGLGDVRDRALFIDLLLPSSQLASILAPMATEGVRLWLIDQQATTFAAAGQADVMVAEPELNSLIDLFYQLVLKQVVSDDESVTHEQSLLAGPIVSSALKGHASTERRKADDQVLLLASQPIILNGDVVGAVIVEQNTNAILGLQNQAVKALLNTMTLAFVVMLVILIGFASRLSFRINRLNRDVAMMVSGEGRLAGHFRKGSEVDELGELRQNFAQLFDRLSLYTDYLEALASRLAHELRTPIAVIRTSLEHLEQTADNRQIYIDRARSGSERLNNIVARMSEVTRLEQSVNNELLQVFDLHMLIADIVPVYQDLHPDIAFKVDLCRQHINIKGSQDLIVQMLDKLIGNAVDFHAINTPIEILLAIADDNDLVKLVVKNTGVHLPEEGLKQLFQPMVSIRTASSQAVLPHLGLGLYIVKLIVDKHLGKVTAANWQAGVEFSIELPITKS